MSKLKSIYNKYELVFEMLGCTLCTAILFVAYMFVNIVVPM